MPLEKPSLNAFYEVVLLNRTLHFPSPAHFWLRMHFSVPHTLDFKAPYRQGLPILRPESRRRHWYIFVFLLEEAAKRRGKEKRERRTTVINGCFLNENVFSIFSWPSYLLPWAKEFQHPFSPSLCHLHCKRPWQLPACLSAFQHLFLLLLRNKCTRPPALLSVSNKAEKL